ncbi:MAG TPA: transcription termination/antitermination protein NusG [Candidatus Binatus sp.]|nr:transcription termination/antitermination protein NusG [Candidatus Binatus sp.]
MASESDAATPPPEGEERMEWYVLKVQSNRDKSIRENIKRRYKREGLERFFGEIIIPTEKVAETKGGKKRVSERKLYPGYIMIQMILNEESWFLVRETSGVGDFTGAAGKPIPMQEHEIKRMMGIEEAKTEAVAPKIKIDFAQNDTVKIKEGTFESFEGTVDSVDQANGRVTVFIEIFGRSTPVELEYWQIEKI